MLPSRIGARVCARMGGAARLDETATPAVPARNLRRDNLPDLLPDLITERLPDLPLSHKIAGSIDPISLCRGFFLVIRCAVRAPRTKRSALYRMRRLLDCSKSRHGCRGAQQQHARGHLRIALAR